jgi:mannonate dehydratase
MQQAPRFFLKQIMGWNGSNDLVALSDRKQAGCSGVVLALHPIPYWQIWSVEEIKNSVQSVNH